MSLTQDGPGFGCLHPTVHKLICGLSCNVYDFDVTLITGTVITQLNNLSLVFLLKVGQQLLCDKLALPQ